MPDFTRRIKRELDTKTIKKGEVSVSTSQRLQVNEKHIQSAEDKVNRLEKQLAEAKQSVQDLLAKRDNIKSSIIQGEMKKHSISFDDVIKMINATPKPSEQKKGDLKDDKTVE